MHLTSLNLFLIFIIVGVGESATPYSHFTNLNITSCKFHLHPETLLIGLNQFDN